VGKSGDQFGQVVEALLPEDDDDELDDEAAAGVDDAGEDVAGAEGVLDGVDEPVEPDPDDSDDDVEAAVEVLDDAPRLSFL
jgi:hypothetical protein